MEEVSQAIQAIEGTHIKEWGKHTSTPLIKVDGTDTYYKSAECWRETYNGFPDHYYAVLEKKSNGMTPKEYKNWLKKMRKKQLRKKNFNNKKI